jgi:hypothetical protein
MSDREQEAGKLAGSYVKEVRVLSDHAQLDDRLGFKLGDWPGSPAKWNGVVFDPVEMAAHSQQGHF